MISTLANPDLQIGQEADSAYLARILSGQFRFIRPGQVQFGIEIRGAIKIAERSSALAGRHGISRFYCQAVSLPWKNVAALHPGDLVVVRGGFRLYPSNLWPWDYESTILRRGYAGTCRIRYLAIINQGKPDLLQHVRQVLLGRYFEIMGKDQLSSLILALSLGVRDQLSSSSERVFKDLGISHVLVLSGMQIGLVFLSVNFVVRFLCRRIFVAHPNLLAVLSFACSAIISGTLVVITDFEISALRAWIACLLIGLARLRERSTSIWRSSIASFLILSLIWPGCWAEAGFQLGFAAIFGIALGQDLADCSSNISGVRYRSWIGVLFSSFFATLFPVLVGCAWFGQFAASAIISNIIVASWFGTAGCYLGIFLLFGCFLEFPFIDQLAMFGRWLVSLSLEVIDFLHGILPAPVSASPGQSMAALFFAMICCLLYFTGRAAVWLRQFNLITGIRRQDDATVAKLDL